VNYIPVTELLNGAAVSLPVVPRDRWQLVPELVRKQLREPKGARAMIINSPANPTGAVYSEKILEELAGIAVENDLVIISDEAYEKFVYGGNRHVSVASLNGMEDRTLTVQTFSKTYGMCGFRVGYAAGPEEIIGMLVELHHYVGLSAPNLSQIAALAALEGPQGRIKENVREYDARRKFVVKRLGELDGFSCDCEPQGAFYVFPSFAFKMSSVKLAHYLANEARVLVVPGTDFGRYGEGHVRISYASPLPVLEEAFDRMERVVKKLK